MYQYVLLVMEMKYEKEEPNVLVVLIILLQVGCFKIHHAFPPASIVLSMGYVATLCSCLFLLVRVVTVR